MRNIASLPLLLALIVSPVAAQTRVTIGRSNTGQPTRYNLPGKPYVVAGYRSAKWGMDETAVRASLASDFPRAAPPVAGTNQVDRTHFLTADLPELSAGEDKATITYVFGATSGKLMAINVVWLLDGNPAPANRARLIEAGSKVVADFMGGQWQPSVIRGVPAGPNMLILFNGTDDGGHGAELRISGIEYDYLLNGKPAKSNPTSGPARLSLRLVADRTNPDIYRIQSGEF